MKKRILSLILASSMALTMIGCGKKSDEKPDNEVKEESAEDSYCYNITALLSENNTYNKVLLQGFSDCLEDYLGAEHIDITSYSVSGEHTSDMLAAAAVAKSPDMIFTAGKSTLTSTKAKTDIIPIIATGIIDFKNTLRIASLNGKSWDKTTGTNVTGVSSKPSIVDQVSLMIEATDDLQTVGILFSPEDTDAIYQNEIFEAYLDQAGIPWKEYSIPSSDTTITVDPEQKSNALTPSKYVAFSAKQGMDNEVLPLGEGTLLGLNSTSSTRVALVSNFWTGGKVLPKTAEVTEEETTEENTAQASTSSKSAKTSDADEEEEPEITLESLIEEACSECSAIYIPFGSLLTDQMNIIGPMATEAGVTVVAGDTTIGQNALVTLFSDPYAIGYAAGKKAVKVFNEEDIKKIKIGTVDSDNSVKLYNGKIAEALGKEFPKSFKELSEFLDTYEYGSTTTRYVATGEDQK